MARPVRLGDRLVGPGEPCYVIAEAGVNHDGDVDRAVALVGAAADAGADAVKFQLFNAAEVASGGARKAGYQLETTGGEGTQREMLAALELPLEAFGTLKRAADDAGIGFVCTCYSAAEIDHIVRLDAAALKFASAQIVEVPLLAHAARTGKPLIVSTGLATLAETADALAATAGADVVLLQCTTSYPAPVEEANLRVMDTLAAAFDVPVGFSDHTLDDVAPIAAVARGAAVVEKHLTYDRGAAGPDHRTSLEPGEFAELVRKLRAAQTALGSPLKQPTPSELPNLPVMRRSLYAATDIPAGTTISEEHVALRRPDAGLPPRLLPQVVGATAREDIAADTPLTLGSLLW
jgi:N-acetylneuraminate synthase/N,N'-diacetyllegionaminate synthase